MKKSTDRLSLISLVFIAISISFCRQKRFNNIEVIVESIKSKTTNKDAVMLYQEIIKYRKQAIPYLLEKIDARECHYVGHLDPLNSNIKSLYNYNGMQTAYAIDLMLSGLHSNDKKQVLVKEDTVLYGRNIIVKAPNYEPLTYEDMVKVKTLYTRWWQTHQNEKMNNLIMDWHNGDRPLSHSVYEWY